MSGEARWADAQRLESWAGEVRVNLIRLAALVVFYANHLVNVSFFRDDPTVTGPFHAAVTALVLAWSAAVMLLYFCLSRRWVPPALKYVSTLWDIGLITVLLALAGGPRSPLLVLYLLVIAATPLRLSLQLVYVATLGCVSAYLFLAGYDEYYGTPDLKTPRAHQIIFILALGTAGILAGQMVRQARRMVNGHPVVVEE